MNKAIERPLVDESPDPNLCASCGYAKWRHDKGDVRCTFVATPHPTPSGDGELRERIAMITVFRDNTPYSNEPTELETLLKQYNAEHVLDEIVQLIDQECAARERALLKRVRSALAVEFKAAQKNLTYHETQTKNPNLIKEWGGVVFGIEQSIECLAQLTQAQKEQS